MLVIRNLKEEKEKGLQEALHNKFLEGTSNSDMSKSPFAEKLLKHILSKGTINLNRKDFAYAKIREIAFDNNLVLTELIFMADPETKKSEKEDTCFVIGIESTVENLGAKKLKYSNFKNAYYRETRINDLYRYLIATRYEREFKGYNNILKMETKLVDDNGDVIVTL